MLSFVKQHMATIAGIEIYPIVSLVIFFTFFVVLLLYVAFAPKEHLDYMSQRPLDNSMPKETAAK